MTIDSLDRRIDTSTAVRSVGRLTKGGAPRADLPAGKSVRHAGPVNRCECHTRIKQVMRPAHVPSSPAGTPAGGKTGYFAGQPITDRLQGQPRLKLTVLKHVSTKTRI